MTYSAKELRKLQQPSLPLSDFINFIDAHILEVVNYRTSATFDVLYFPFIDNVVQYYKSFGYTVVTDKFTLTISWS